MPLTDRLSSERLDDWDEVCDEAFETMKATVAKDTLLIYPDHNRPFVVETDASDYQMGAVILQAPANKPDQLRPVAFFSKKLNAAQKNYATIEKELSEDDLYKLELDSFMRLVETKQTQERIKHTLSTGKSLVN